MAAHFEPVVNADCRLVAPPPTRRTAIDGYPKVASYDMLGGQLYYSNPVKHGCQSGMWKRLFFKRFRFHQQKTRKIPLTIFFNFCGFVACLLLRFIILRKQKPLFTAITLPTSLEHIVSNYFEFVFLRYQNSC